MYATAAAAASTSSFVSFGEVMILVALVLVALGTVLGKRIENTLLSMVIQLVFILGAGILLAAAYPHKLLVPLYHVSGGKLGIPG